MSAQAWITVTVFVAAVVFSIVMAAISPAFRNKWELKNMFSYAIFFLMIVVAGMMLSLAAHCSVTGRDDDNKWCGAYAWTLTLLILVIFGLFIAYNVVEHIQEKKDKDAVTTTVATTLHSDMLLKPMVFPEV